jgi:ribosomal-protein-alanine N-acetyltransferase
MVRLRAGTAADVPAMHALDLLCFEPPFQFDLRTMKFFASQRNAIVLVAEAAGAIVGFVIVELRLRSRAPSAYVVTLDVDPAHRREGVASRLIEEVDRLVSEAGVQHVSLHVYAGNDAAIRFYEGRGYRRVLDARDFYGSGLDGFLYLKAL